MKNKQKLITLLIISFLFSILFGGCSYKNEPDVYYFKGLILDKNKHNKSVEYCSDEFNDKKSYFNKNGLALHKQNGLYGLINNQGTIIVPPQYKKFLGHKESYFIVFSNDFYDLNELKIVYDKDGKIVFQTKKFVNSVERNNHILISENENDNKATLYNLITKETKPINIKLETLMGDIYPINDKYLAIKSKGSWGVIDYDGKVIIPLEYMATMAGRCENHFNEEDFFFFIKPQNPFDYYTIITLENKELLPPDINVSKILFTVDKSGNIYIEENTKITKEEMDKVRFKGLMAGFEVLERIKKHNENPTNSYFYNIKDKTISKIEYEATNYFKENDTYLIKKGNHYGLMKSDKQIILQPIYEKLFNISNSYITFEKDGKFGILNLSGDVLVQPIYDEIIYNYGDVELSAKKKNGWENINLKGELLPSNDRTKRLYGMKCQKGEINETK